MDSSKSIKIGSFYSNSVSHYFIYGETEKLFKLLSFSGIPGSLLKEYLDTYIIIPSIEFDIKKALDKGHMENYLDNLDYIEILAELKKYDTTRT